MFPLIYILKLHFRAKRLYICALCPHYKRRGIMGKAVYTRKKRKYRKTRIISYGIISKTTLFNFPLLQRLHQEALVYSRITSHFCEIYLTPRVGEYSRAPSYSKISTYFMVHFALSFSRITRFLILFYILRCLLISRVGANTYTDDIRAQFWSFSKKNLIG